MPGRPRWRSARLHRLRWPVHAPGSLLANDIRSHFLRCASEATDPRHVEVTGTKEIARLQSELPDSKDIWKPRIFLPQFDG